MKKRLFIVALCVLLIGLLCACSSKKDAEQETSSQDNTTAAFIETTVAPEEEETEEYYEEQADVDIEVMYTDLGNILNNNLVSTWRVGMAPGRAADPADYPAKFDLRDQGVVTPVKRQSPWGTCWAFGTIAACETSILSEKNKTYEQYPIDLSEHHLMWFALSHLEDGSSQDGEGMYLKDQSYRFSGNMPYATTALLAAGVGPALEKDFPYRGKKGIKDGDECYSADDDWTIDSSDQFIQAYELEESRILSPTVIVDEDGSFVTFDDIAFCDIKEELMNGRGVAMSYLPDPDYYNEYTFAQYYPEVTGSTHSVCIVGWDDDFSASNFLDHSDDADGDGTPMRPEGDGAWLVKNSWGAETEDFPNAGEFGIVDEDGLYTGYFWLSYYDCTISNLVSFDFDVEGKASDYYLVDQYDYMFSSEASGSYSTDGMAMANVFEAEEDECLRSISLETATPETIVTYEIYKLTDPEGGLEDAQFCTSGEEEYRYAGYHRIELTEPQELNKGEKYAVVFMQQAVVNDEDVFVVTYHSGNNITTTLDENGNESDDWFNYTVGVVNPGESYLYTGKYNKWIDWCEMTEYMKAVYTSYRDYDNFSIKGYADPVK